MFSAFYWYLEIRHDSKYTKSTNSADLISFIESTSLLTHSGNGSFSSDKPWIKLGLELADQEGDCIHHEKCPDNINIITILGSKGTESFSAYREILVPIAKYLQWELIDEDNGEDTNFVIWSETVSEESGIYR